MVIKWKNSSSTTCMYDIIKSILLKKEKLYQVTVKQFTVFSMNDSFQNTPRPSWEIQMDWENDI